MTALLAGEVEQYSRERQFRTKDGTLIPAHTSVIVVREGSGEVNSWSRSSSTSASRSGSSRRCAPARSG